MNHQAGVEFLLRAALGLAMAASVRAQNTPAPPVHPPPPPPGVAAPLIPGAASRGGLCPGCTRSALSRIELETMHKHRSIGGKVVLVQGSITYPVELRVTCDKRPYLTTYTDRKGNFSIGPEDWAPFSKPRTARSLFESLVGCTAEAIAPGFHSDVITIPNVPVLELTDIGTITLRRAEGADGIWLGPAPVSPPRDARVAFDHALQDLEAGKLVPAGRSLEKAVARFPKYAEAWYELGMLQENAGSSAARNSYKQAMAADPQFLLPCQRMMVITARDREWKETAEYASRALKLAPHDYPEAWYFDALAKYNLGQTGPAEKSALRGLSNDSNGRAPELEQVLGAILYDRQDYAGALQHLRNYLRLAPAEEDTSMQRQEIEAVEMALGVAKSIEPSAGTIQESDFFKRGGTAH